MAFEIPGSAPAMVTSLRTGRRHSPVLAIGAVIGTGIESSADFLVDLPPWLVIILIRPRRVFGSPCWRIAFFSGKVGFAFRNGDLGLWTAYRPSRWC